MADLKNGLPASSGAVFDPDEAERGRTMLFADVQARTAEAVRRETEAWRVVASVPDWEAFRDRRLAALRDSLGTFPPVPDDFRAEVTGEIAGDGYRIHKLIFETRPGILVTAHLYLPDPTRQAMPGIQVVHAHHRPKEQAELQDMGVNWARTGCAVLVPDLFGHGERREDPFGARQGYYSRYYTSMQLRLVGECLIGWMVWDLMRGVDVLLDVPGIDRERIIMIGAVAGGGDPAAVAVALDPRVTCSVPFNFGSGAGWRNDLGTPTPEGRNLAGWAYWETTRNLYLSARDEFFPWLIVAAAAPRPLVSAHEFAWDKDNDPAWHRMQKVYELHGASERLGWMKGEGRCAPGAGNTHCTNVGPIHRAGIYPYFKAWFGMEAPEPEIQERREEAELACLTEAVAPRKRLLREVIAEMAAERLTALRAELNALPPARRRTSLRQRWARVLGDVDPSPVPVADVRGRSGLDGAVAERIVLEAEPGIVVPTRLLLPGKLDGPAPVVVAVAQQGNAAFLHERGDDVAGLLEAGVAVCLPDVRGTGETQPGRMHGCESYLIDLSEQELMLGRTLMGRQLRTAQSRGPRAARAQQQGRRRSQGSRRPARAGHRRAAGPVARHARGAVRGRRQGRACPARTGWVRLAVLIVLLLRSQRLRPSGHVRCGRDLRPGRSAGAGAAAARGPPRRARPRRQRGGTGPVVHGHDRRLRRCSGTTRPGGGHPPGRGAVARRRIDLTAALCGPLCLGDLVVGCIDGRTAALRLDLARGEG